MKTSTPTREQQLDRQWFVIDADNKVLGKVAAEAARVLRGKHKATFTPHMDMGDHVIIINAEKIAVTGAKMEQKNYYTHSGVPGNLKVRKLGRQMNERPLKVLETAIRGMLPKNKLRDVCMSKLHLYEGTEHKHEAQQPQSLDI